MAERNIPGNAQNVSQPGSIVDGNGIKLTLKRKFVQVNTVGNNEVISAVPGATLRILSFDVNCAEKDNTVKFVQDTVGTPSDLSAEQEVSRRGNWFSSHLLTLGWYETAVVNKNFGINLDKGKKVNVDILYAEIT